MSLSSVTSFLNPPSILGVTPSDRQKQPGSTLATAVDSDLSAIREKGLSAWAHEKRMEALKEKLRAEVLSERKMSEDDLNALPPEQKASVESEIQTLIEERLKEAMQRAVEKAAEGGKTQAILVDISV